MRLRMVPAAVVIGASVLVGSTGVSAAAAPAKPHSCAYSARRVEKLNDKLARVTDALTRAQADARIEAVDRLTARSAKIQSALDGIGTTQRNKTRKGCV